MVPFTKLLVASAGYDDHTDGTAQETALGGSLKLTETTSNFVNGTTSGYTNGYYEEEGSGFRFTLSNNSATDKAMTDFAQKEGTNLTGADGHFRMRKAYFATSKIPFVNNKDDEEVKAGKKPAGLVNYYTEKVALSAALFEHSTVKDLTLYWRPYDTATQEPATSDASLTIDGADLRTFAAVANQAALDAVTDRKSVV